MPAYPHRTIIRSLTVVCLSLLLASCAQGPEQVDITPDVDWDVLANMSQDDEPRMSWREDVQPVLEQRCIVCHGCFDAPCQLKLTSYEGLTRGANPAKVYNGSRIRAAQPTRLGIDASSTEEWREMGFHGVLNRQDETALTPPERLRESVLYRMLRLKQLNPQPRTGMLPPSVTTDLDRAQTCTVQEDIAKFERDNPQWGMPYGLPNLEKDEYQTLVAWLAEGATPPEPAQPSPEAAPQIERWEEFLNGSTNREKLVSRYIYEHLFLGHLHFEGTSNREFYRLVRSYTPPGQPVQEIATTRPFDDPGVRDFWYRLRIFDASIVAKSHLVYSLSDARMARYKELFFSRDYEVAELPGYEMPDAANAFKTFAPIPPNSRYRFLLDESRYFIMGFIKGPVCRGQVALNVIEDQFWVLFSDPESKDEELIPDALNQVADYLQMPTSTQTFNIFAAYGRYWDKQKQYMQARSDYFENIYAEIGDEAFSGIWDGDGTNPNAALTVFRNLDSAAVEHGLLGDYPETAWIIDYPLFERIHYLLVAGFDVYGNVGHQLNSRLFMDFLRMEGEDTFLTYLPKAKRKEIRDQWYQGIRQKRKKYFEEPMIWLELESPITYLSSDPQRELYELIETYLGDVAGQVDYLNRCERPECASTGKTAKVREADRIMKRLHEKDREALQEESEYLGVAPDIMYVRVLMDDEPDINYTILRNKSYTNLTSFLGDGDGVNRDPVNDTYTILRQFSGSYPNFFLVVPFDELEGAVEEMNTIVSLDEYQSLVARYGVRRTNTDFWEHSDWFNDRYAEEQPIEHGVLDLLRYGNY
ncbi:MAG: fatty acid cis/trans isomerase [Gammaproteobacteria bacterium]